MSNHLLNIFYNCLNYGQNSEIIEVNNLFYLQNLSPKADRGQSNLKRSIGNYKPVLLSFSDSKNGDADLIQGQMNTSFRNKNYGLIITE